MFVIARQHVAELDLLPELRQQIEQMIAHDMASSAVTEHWSAVIPALQYALGIDGSDVAPFAEAWCLMYRAISRLDHIQDNDPDADPLFADTITPAIRYNLALSYYVLAVSMLDRLSTAVFLATRLLRLRALWSEQMLRMASGQQRDLLGNLVAQNMETLALYQEIAQYKTGASFALAFGGISILATDDETTIEALTTVGEVYGLLLQCSDDLLDIDQQLNETITFSQALNAPYKSGSRLSAEHFWSYLYPHYMAFVAETISPLSKTLRSAILQLFVNTFGQPLAKT